MRYAHVASLTGRGSSSPAPSPHTLQRGTTSPPSLPFFLSSPPPPPSVLFTLPPSLLPSLPQAISKREESRREVQIELIDQGKTLPPSLPSSLPSSLPPSFPSSPMVAPLCPPPHACHSNTHILSTTYSSPQRFFRRFPPSLPPSLPPAQAQGVGMAAKMKQSGTPWYVIFPYYALCAFLDIIYEGRPLARFWFLETVARYAPPSLPLSLPPSLNPCLFASLPPCLPIVPSNPGKKVTFH